MNQKNLRIFYLFVFIFLLCQPVIAYCANGDSGLKKLQMYREEFLPGFHKASTLTEATGVTISPLFGILLKGGIDYIKHDSDAGPLPLHASPEVLFIVLVILFLIGIKDTFGELLGPLKKPLDVVDGAQYIVSGILAAMIVIPQLASIVEPQVRTGVAFIMENFVTSTAYAADSITNQNLQNNLIDIIVTPLAMFASSIVFAVIWIASNSINVLTILIPVPFFGLLLKMVRMGIVTILVIAEAIHPFLGLGVSIVLIIICYIISRWSFNLTIFGTVVIKDYLFKTWRNKTYTIGSGVRAFSSNGLRKIPVRSYGKLTLSDDCLVFSYRPWLIFPRKTVHVEPAPSRLRIAKSLLFCQIIGWDAKKNSIVSYFYLPPKYRGHETDIASMLGLPPDIHDIGLRKGLKSTINWFSSQSTNRKHDETVVS